MAGYTSSSHPSWQLFSSASSSVSGASGIAGNPALPSFRPTALRHSSFPSTTRAPRRDTRSRSRCRSFCLGFRSEYTRCHRSPYTSCTNLEMGCSARSSGEDEGKVFGVYWGYSEENDPSMCFHKLKVPCEEQCMIIIKQFFLKFEITYFRYIYIIKTIYYFWQNLFNVLCLVCYDLL